MRSMKLHRFAAAAPVGNITDDSGSCTAATGDRIFAGLMNGQAFVLPVHNPLLRHARTA